MATTESNLKTAFAGESQANRKYLAFAKKAEQEGFSNVARLFRTAAEAETIHALGHSAALGGIGATLDNVRAAMAGETYEYSEMYPPMLEQATTDNHRAGRMFSYALKAEAVHAKLYQMAWKLYNRDTTFPGWNSTCVRCAGISRLARRPRRAPYAVQKASDS